MTLPNQDHAGAPAWNLQKNTWNLIQMMILCVFQRSSIRDFLLVSLLIRYECCWGGISLFYSYISFCKLVLDYGFGIFLMNKLSFFNVELIFLIVKIGYLIYSFEFFHHSFIPLIVLKLGKKTTKNRAENHKLRWGNMKKTATAT